MTYFGLCRAAGRLLRSARYSRSRLVDDRVRKHRAFYAPLLIGLSVPLVRILDGGVRVLHQREWEERERRLYHDLHDASVGVVNGTLILPVLPGKSLATWLEDPDLEEPVRMRAIDRAVAALASFHRAGFTHADAMAENVMVDLEGGAAEWFDFETVHDEDRTMTWRRADDLRALLVTCLLRTARERVAETLRRILDVYHDAEVTRHLAEGFDSVWRRPLALHLAQAALTHERYREIGRLLKERVP
jgi:tRNA A-37 threonylcarbamoyl transferase component Bud32